MDNLEMRILEVLTDDARTPVGQIAVMLGRTEAEIAAAIAEMEERRIILKYPALVNWDKVDSGEVEALIEVRVTPQRGHGFDAIAEAPIPSPVLTFRQPRADWPPQRCQPAARRPMP